MEKKEKPKQAVKPDVKPVIKKPANGFEVAAAENQKVDEEADKAKKLEEAKKAKEALITCCKCNKTITEVYYFCNDKEEPCKTNYHKECAKEQEHSDIPKIADKTPEAKKKDEGNQ